MNVSCPECRSVYRVDPTKIPALGVRARCSVCGGVITLGVGSSIDEEFGPAREPAVAHASSASSAWAAPASATGTPPAATSPATAIPPATATPAVPSAPAKPMSASAKPMSAPAAPPPAQQRPAAPAARPMVFPPRPAGTTPPSGVSVSGASARPRTPAFPPRPAVPPATPPRPFAPVRPAAAPPHAGLPAPAPTRPSAATPSRAPINPFLANDPNAKARRLSRALVSDLVTYYPQRRDEGLRDGTLKDLFREEIKKSYEEYVEQVGKEFAESTTHFQDALNDILAGGQKMF